ncbi:MAG: sodium-dependent transporter, partial [Paludibacteraceae bacterium]|nr:sodium-dependent transporter [Paludibacteraceae bacterium]
IIACLTSLMSLHEVVIAYFMDKRGLSRRKASLLITIVVIVLGILSSLSMGKLNDLRLFGKTFFDILDFISASICLPLGGMLMSIFVAWILGKDKFVSGLTNDGKIVVNKTLLNGVFFLLKYIVPMAILIIFITSLL